MFLDTYILKPSLKLPTSNYNFFLLCLFVFDPPSNMNKSELKFLPEKWKNISWGETQSILVLLFSITFYQKNCQACVLFVALLIANWSVSVGNSTQNNITIQWPNLTPILNGSVLHYFGLIKSTNSSILNCHIMSAKSTSVAFTGLLQYREYRLSVVGVNGIGQAYSSAEVTAWTEEGGVLYETYKRE